MKLLKFDIEVPFWCSFGEFGTLNIQQTYPLVHPPALFGLIQNALGKPAIHTIPDEIAKEKYTAEMLDSYKKLSFAIIVRSKGERIDDYTNILKGQRSQEIETKEGEFSKNIIAKIKSFGFYSQLSDDKKKEFDKKVKPVINRLKIGEIEPLADLLKLIGELDVSGNKLKNVETGMNETLNEVRSYWGSLSETRIYEIKRKWMRTQIVTQKLVSPRYTIFLKSGDLQGEYSLENISKYLRDPKRPLYLGKSDDLVSVLLKGDGIMESNGVQRSNISSIVPGIHAGCQIIEIPIKIRNDIPGNTNTKNFKMTCSIPLSNLKHEVPCESVEGDNIVFLE